MIKGKEDVEITMEKYKEKLKITRVYATRDEIEILKGRVNTRIF
jgi:hypothetical protein